MGLGKHTCIAVAANRSFLSQHKPEARSIDIHSSADALGGLATGIRFVEGRVSGRRRA